MNRFLGDDNIPTFEMFTTLRMDSDAGFSSNWLLILFKKPFVCLNLCDEKCFRSYDFYVTNMLRSIVLVLPFCNRSS